MNHKAEVIFDYDKEMDIMYLIRDGYDSGKLSNIDSDRIPGIVKRTEPETGECVGFIIHGVSRLIPSSLLENEKQLKTYLCMSLDKTNELCLLTPFAA